ncbi:MAG TPA: BON domain-containing protein, partial [Candidatus Saccharimonadales bacterium]|nr:BON domain-containing protein [Candidatus Saccharimonadales bacterium]
TLAAALLLTTASAQNAPVKEKGPDGSGSVQSPSVDSKGAADKDVDNTGINKRDRGDGALTSGDQSGSKSDRELTRKIRREITKNKELSTTAKNIKIITTNGKVTLRGPVKSEEERTTIVTAAKSAAGDSQVDNQLEVKQTTEKTDK